MSLVRRLLRCLAPNTTKFFLTQLLWSFASTVAYSTLQVTTATITFSHHLPLLPTLISTCHKTPHLLLPHHPPILLTIPSSQHPPSLLTTTSTQSELGSMLVSYSSLQAIAFTLLAREAIAPSPCASKVLLHQGDSYVHQSQNDTPNVMPFPKESFQSLYF